MASVGTRIAAVTRTLVNRAPAWRSALGARAISSGPGQNAPVQPALASEPRVEEEVPASYAASGATVASLNDEEVFRMAASGQIKAHNLEEVLGDRTRAVAIRRRLVAHLAATPTEGGSAGISGLPHEAFDARAFYDAVDGANCENVIGYLPLPVGVIGPLSVDGKDYMVPLATTEGALVASTNRGARAIAQAGGVRTALTGDGMTRAPLLRMPSLEAARDLKNWLDTPEAKEEVAAAFASTSRFGRMQSLATTVVGRNVYLRFKCNTGDAMGMNMITKGVNASLATIVGRFPTSRVLSLSGNMCTDKKPSAINWVDGRGKSVVAEVVLPKEVVEGTLKTTAAALVELNIGKNLVGSAAAGSLGGFNAHAANIVSAVFLATGQDVAQNVESSSCITLLEHDDASPGGVIASVTMPSIEVGTVGGGTGLASQAACLDLLGLRGASLDLPGSNASTLARVVAASVLAGELSLMAAHTTGDLLRAHMALNRAATPAAAATAAPSQATGAAATHTAAAAAAARMPPPTHSMASTAGGAGPFKAPELRVSPVGRRYFAAAMHRAPAEPVCASKPAPASLSRANTAPISAADVCPVMMGV